MESVEILNWTRIFIGEELGIGYFLEIAIRVLIIYLIALVFLRAGGKRARKQTTPLDMLLLVALGSGVGDVMFTPTLPILYPTLVILIVIVIQFGVNRLKLGVTKVENVINSVPRVIIEKGVIDKIALSEETLSEQEVYSELRKQGIDNLNKVKYLYLEIDGNYSCFESDNPYEGIDSTTLLENSSSKMYRS